jgi:hypothetical protein
MRGRRRHHAIRAAIALLLLSLLGAPLARAASSTFASNPHGCCPGAAPAPQSPPCQFAAPYACCGETGIPEAAADRAAPVLVFAPFALVATGAPIEPPRMLALRGMRARVPIPPLLLNSVLLL